MMIAEVDESGIYSLMTVNNSVQVCVCTCAYVYGCVVCVCVCVWVCGVCGCVDICSSFLALH